MVHPSGQRPSYTFSKAERLKSRTRIKALFNESASFGLYPLRILYRLEPGRTGAPVQVLVTASKRRFRHAYQRNRIKRQLREAYRLHKHPLPPLVPENQTLLLAIVYTGKEPVPFAELADKLKKGLGRLSEKAPFHKSPQA